MYYVVEGERSSKNKTDGVNDKGEKDAERNELFSCGF